MRKIPSSYLFGVCMLPLILGILIFAKGDDAMGLMIGIPSAIGSIVLPIASKMRER